MDKEIPQDLDVALISWHESGHAAWALRDGRRVIRLTRKRSAVGLEEAKGYCEIEPETWNDEEADIYHLLSGIAGEEVGSEIDGFEFRREQLEWHQAANGLWALDAFRGMAYDYSREVYAPSKYYELLSSKYYPEILLRAREDALLPSLVAALKRRDTLEEGDVEEVINAHKSKQELSNLTE